MAESDIDLMTSEALARSAGYRGVTNAFRNWCAKLHITLMPGRRGYFDRKLVRRRYDEAQGLANR